MSSDLRLSRSHKKSGMALTVTFTIDKGLLITLEPGGREDRITSYNVCYTKLLRKIIICVSKAGVAKEIETLSARFETLKKNNETSIKKSYNFV